MYIQKYEKKGKPYYMFKAYGGMNPETGKKRCITRRGFPTQKEAELEFYRIKLQIDNGTFGRADKHTFQEVYDLWVEQYKNTVKESTLNKTLTLFRCHILPKFGDRYMNMIKVTHCQGAVNCWYQTIQNFRSVNNYTGMIFRYAIKMGLIEKDPTSMVTMPIRKDKAGEDGSFWNFYSKEELVSFLGSIESDKKWYAFFRLLASSGLRKSEALALTWKDVDFKDEKIAINKTLANGVGNKLILQSPKTSSSKRIVSLDSGTMNTLREWKAQQALDMLKFGFNTLSSGQLLFSNQKNTFINPQKIGQILNRFCKTNGLRVITPHGFRHTHCSLLIESGATPKEIQVRLGHSNIQITMNTYAHLTENRKVETATKFGQYIGI